jgi:hypothetical protein
MAGITSAIRLFVAFNRAGGFSVNSSLNGGNKYRDMSSSGHRLAKTAAKQQRNSRKTK